MIAIVVAMNKEAKHFIEKMTDLKIKKALNKDIYFGKFNGKECVLMISGIGKVNSALTTQYLIDNYKPEFLLNFGTTGAIDSNMKVGDIYICKKAIQFDFDLSEIDNCEVGYMEEYDTKFFDCDNEYLKRENAIGVLATSDRFSDNQQDIDFLRSIGCNLKDMEGGAIFQVCKANNTKLLMIKAVSDVANDESMINQYLQNVKIASKKLIDYLEENI
ncbi:MAG: 5'-methylthioadenosine/S-adenosylhomocysteine nucleosidase [Clostridia bacterium]|nr:5'-methylthioadenosine/S-adenosylhomocysteine nucleosidase [Clostridia bacterium]